MPEIVYLIIRPVEAAVLKRRSVIREVESARDPKANRERNHVLPEGLIGIGHRNPVLQVIAQVAIPVIHRDVSEHIVLAVFIRRLRGVLKALTVGTRNGVTGRTVDVSDADILRIPLAVGHEHGVALTTAQLAIRIAAGFPRR